MKKTLRLLCILLLLCGAVQAAEPFTTPVYQSPTVVAAMRVMWRSHVDGKDGSESTIILHLRRPDGTPVVRTVPDTKDFSRETFPLMPGDTAVIHTHPASKDPHPSEADKKIADKYGIEMFTLSAAGVYRYKTGEGTTLVVDGTSFLADITPAQRAATNLRGAVALAAGADLQMVYLAKTGDICYLFAKSVVELHMNGSLEVVTSNRCRQANITADVMKASL